MKSYLTKAGIPTLLQPPYSPDVALWTFFVFLPEKASILRQQRGSKQYTPWLSRLFQRMHTMMPSMLGNCTGSAALMQKELILKVLQEL
jgi:hypothetical protein